MNDNKHVCSICGHEYTYCDYCRQMLSIGITPWRAICDTIHCYNVHMDIREIKAGRENISIIEDLKLNLQTLKENNVEIRESVTDYLKTLNFLQEKKVEQVYNKVDSPNVDPSYDTYKKKNKK